jgi:hypothetical protein
MVSVGTWGTPPPPHFLKIHHHVHKNMPHDPFIHQIKSTTSHSISLKSILTLPSMHAQFSQVLFHLQVAWSKFVCIYLCKYATCPGCNVLHLIAPNNFHWTIKLWSLSLHNFLLPPVTSCLMSKLHQQFILKQSHSNLTLSLMMAM